MTFSMKKKIKAISMLLILSTSSESIRLPKIPSKTCIPLNKVLVNQYKQREIILQGQKLTLYLTQLFKHAQYYILNMSWQKENYIQGFSLLCFYIFLMVQSIFKTLFFLIFWPKYIIYWLRHMRFIPLFRPYLICCLEL